MNDRPVVHHLDPSDLERSAADPRLGSLAAAGWTVAAWSQSALKQQPDKLLVTLLLWPPARHPDRWWTLAAQVVWLVAGVVWLVAGIVGVLS